jgi:tetratricopeptide (TPR) repeat protein
MTDRSPRPTQTQYDVFISHSSADKTVAKDLKSALERFPRPLFGGVAHRVFLDEHGLRTGDAVWEQLEAALGASRHLLVLASPAAKTSEGVARELCAWRADSTRHRVLIALSSGCISWDEGRADFDPQRTNAVPQGLLGAYGTLPKWADVSGKNAQQLSRHPRHWSPELRDQLCQLVGAIRGVSTDQVRRAYRLARALPILVLLIVVALVGWIAISEHWRAREQQLEASLESGFHELGQHRLDAARDHFEDVMRARADDPEPLAGIALVELAANRPEAALTRIDAWSATRKQQPALMVVRADALRRLHRDDEAAALDVDLATNGSALECYLRSVIELDRRDRGLPARADPHRLARLAVQRSTKQRALFHFQLARAAAATGDRAEAVDVADTIERHWPTHAQSRFYAAVALRFADPQRTLAIFEDLASRPTANAHDHANLAQALLDQNRVDAADAAADRAIRLDGGAANALRRELKARVMLARFEASKRPADLEALVAWLHGSCADHPGSAGLLNRLGHALALQGRSEEAIATMQLAIAAGSDDAATFQNLGALVRETQPAEAHALFERAVAAHRRQGTDATMSRLALARAMLEDDGTRGEGLAELTRLHTETGSTAVGMELARTLLEDGRASAADDVLAAMQVHRAELGPVLMLRSALAAARGRWSETRHLLGDWEPPLADRGTADAVVKMLTMAGDFASADRLLVRLRSAGHETDDGLAMVSAFKSAHADVRARTAGTYVDGGDRGSDLVLGIAATALEDWGQAAHSFLRARDALAPFEVMAASAAARVALSPQVEPRAKVRAAYSRFARDVVNAMLTRERASQHPERRLRASLRLLAEVPGLVSTREPGARNGLPLAEQEAWASAWREWDRYR